MHKFYILAFLFCVLHSKAQKHKVTIEDLTTISFLPSAAYAEYVKQKGFRTIAESSVTAETTLFRTNKDKTVRQVISRRENAETVFIAFQTTSVQEYLSWQQELEQSKYLPYTQRAGSLPKSIAAFQKGTIIAKIQQLQDSTPIQFCITLENKKLPLATAIHYAEDLLELSSHEYITAVFGAANVKKDQFYFSETEANKCSILFPNTSNQVIFVWNDENNYQDISFLILGGLGNKPSQTAIFTGNQFHKWRSRQGIYLGMTLRELQTLNGKPIEFYDWSTDQPGFVVTKNNGRINLKNLGIQLHCLECIDERHATSQPILTSETVLYANKRVLVNSLIILPDKPDAPVK